MQRFSSAYFQLVLTVLQFVFSPPSGPGRSLFSFLVYTKDSFWKSLTFVTIKLILHNFMSFSFLYSSLFMFSAIPFSYIYFYYYCDYFSSALNNKLLLSKYCSPYWFLGLQWNGFIQSLILSCMFLFKLIIFLLLSITSNKHFWNTSCIHFLFVCCCVCIQATSICTWATVIFIFMVTSPLSFQRR